MHFPNRVDDVIVLAKDFDDVNVMVEGLGDCSNQGLGECDNETNTEDRMTVALL